MTGAEERERERERGEIDRKSHRDINKRETEEEKSPGRRIRRDEL